MDNIHHIFKQSRIKEFDNFIIRHQFHSIAKQSQLFQSYLSGILGVRKNSEQLNHPAYHFVS